MLFIQIAFSQTIIRIIIVYILINVCLQDILQKKVQSRHLLLLIKKAVNRKTPKGEKKCGLHGGMLIPLLGTEVILYAIDLIYNWSVFIHPLYP